MLRYFLIALCIAGLMAQPAQALPKEIAEKQCRYQWMDKAVWSDREERRTAACVVEKFGVVGGLDMLVRVGECESHWYRFALGDGYLGIFQHQASAWSGRVHSMMPDAWKVGAWTRWTNPRSQIVTTVRMVNGAGGWSAWSCG